MTLDLTWVSYAIAAIVVYYLALFVVSLRPARAPRHDSAAAPLLFVLVTPARNEEAVIESTLRSQLELSANHLMMVVDDGSTDATGRLIHHLARQDRRIIVVDRVAPNAGTGKSDALNSAYRLIDELRSAGDARFEGFSADQVIVGIVDADGKLSDNSLNAVGPWFADPRMGSVQIAVQIGNALQGVLTRLQDMEFVAFSYFVQVARNRLGSSGLGGNGQFTRLSALQGLGPTPWDPRSLTEDLDLGLRLVMAGWRTAFCNEAVVTQQGLPGIRALFRQRTRWIQGHYQCWKHLPKLAASGRASVVARLDLANYLILVTSVSLIALDFIAGWLGVAHVLTVQNSFLDFLSPISQRNTQLFLATAPLIAFTFTYQRRSLNPLRWWELPTYAVIFSVYSYFWAFATARAFGRMALRRWTWVKTPRVPEGPGPIEAGRKTLANT